MNNKLVIISLGLFFSFNVKGMLCDQSYLCVESQLKFTILQTGAKITRTEAAVAKAQTILVENNIDLEKLGLSSISDAPGVGYFLRKAKEAYALAQKAQVEKNARAAELQCDMSNRGCDQVIVVCTKFIEAQLSKDLWTSALQEIHSIMDSEE